MSARTTSIQPHSSKWITLSCSAQKPSRCWHSVIPEQNKHQHLTILVLVVRHNKFCALFSDSPVHPNAIPCACLCTPCHPSRASKDCKDYGIGGIERCNVLVVRYCICHDHPEVDPADCFVSPVVCMCQQYIFSNRTGMPSTFGSMSKAAQLNCQ